MSGWSPQEVTEVLAALATLCTALCTLIATVRNSKTLGSVHEQTNGINSRLQAVNDRLQGTQATADELLARASVPPERE